MVTLVNILETYRVSFCQFVVMFYLIEDIKGWCLCSTFTFSSNQNTNAVTVSRINRNEA